MRKIWRMEIPRTAERQHAGRNPVLQTTLPILLDAFSISSRSHPAANPHLPKQPEISLLNMRERLAKNQGDVFIRQRVKNRSPLAPRSDKARLF